MVLHDQTLSHYLHHIEEGNAELIAAGKAADEAIEQNEQGKYGKAIINYQNAVKLLLSVEKSWGTLGNITYRGESYYDEDLEEFLQEYRQRIKTLQSLKKDKTKRAIIEFLKSHPQSSNGDIWKHIRDDDETRVSLKTFNDYLEELQQPLENEVQRKTENKPGRKYPRYSIVPETEKKWGMYSQYWRDWIQHRLEKLKKDATKENLERLLQQIHFVYSVIIQLQHRQRIMQEISKRKFFTTKDSQAAENLNRNWQLEIDQLFEILNKLPKKRQEMILERMKYLSEGNFVKILDQSHQSHGGDAILSAHLYVDGIH